MGNHTIESTLQALRAVVARELVLGQGFTRTRAAEMLGVTSPAVSQYVSGKRCSTLVQVIEHDKTHVKTINELVESVLTSSAHEYSTRHFLRAAEKILKRIPKANTQQAPYSKHTIDLKWLEVLRDRLHEEQKAASDSMSFANKCEDELMKALFRQIATDSLRHADIVSILINYCQHPDLFEKQLPSLDEVNKLIEQEEAADEASISPLKRMLGNNARLLIESIEADERKHVLLLKGLKAIIEERNNSQ